MRQHADYQRELTCRVPAMVVHDLRTRPFGVRRVAVAGGQTHRIRRGPGTVTRRAAS